MNLIYLFKAWKNAFLNDMIYNKSIFLMNLPHLEFLIFLVNGFILYDIFYIFLNSENNLLNSLSNLM